MKLGIKSKHHAFAVGLLALSFAGGVGCAPDGSSEGGDLTLMGGRTEPTQPRNYGTDVLIFDGTAAAYGDADAIESIVDDRGLSSVRVSSAELDSMSVDDLADYGVIVWPGGYAGTQSNSISASTRENIRRAVHERGTGFVGFCAGAFIAVSPAAEAGEEGPAWGLAILAQQTLEYYHLENEGTESAMVSVKLADGSTRDLVWWGGPYVPEVKGGVIARYSDTGQPAISETWAGAGLLVIAGPHPEAPEDWRSNLGLEDMDGLDQDIAGDMIVAALKQKPMKAMD